MRAFEKAKKVIRSLYGVLLFVACRHACMYLIHAWE